MPYRYFVTRNGKEREVGVQEFVYAEREAGFRGPGHLETPPSPATASFGATLYPNTPQEITIRGRTEWVPNA